MTEKKRRKLLVRDTSELNSPHFTIMTSLGFFMLHLIFAHTLCHMSWNLAQAAVCPLQELCNGDASDNPTHPEVSCSAEVRIKVKSCHFRRLSMTTNGHSQCTREITFDCQKQTVYWKVVVARHDEESQDPVWSLNDTEALSGFVTSSLALRNLGIDWIKPRVFFKLSSSLRELDLSFNYIKTLHQHTFFRAMRLRIIYLAYNQLTEIPSSAIKKLFRLLKLYFKGNKIERISKSSFPCLKGLRYIDLSENRITAIDDGSFFCFGLLKTLNLAENRLSSLKKYFIRRTSELTRIRHGTKSSGDCSC